MRRLLAALDKIDAITDTIPVKEARNRRFGDPAFRDWLSALDELISSGLLTDMLPSTLHPAEIELQGYLMASFGDRQRIDYGTGHELSFLAFLISLSLLGFFSREDDRAVVLLAFDRYLRICRKLQRKYFLEPAGSHGVWGLDDHQFLPYLWGASQLIGGKIQVRSATVPRTSEDWAGSYLYVDALAHIHATKKGPFNEHSPLLYDISGLPDWNRVAQGLLRMWCGEVLGKRVVVQHLGLGKCLPWEVAKFEESDADVASSSAN